MSERELRDGVFFADVGEEEVRRAVERVIHESVFDAGVVVLETPIVMNRVHPIAFLAAFALNFLNRKKELTNVCLAFCRVCSIRK